MGCMLGQEILRVYEHLIKLVADIPSSCRDRKIFEGTGGKVSIADLIAYQIGWGRCLIRWYEAGIKGEEPQMPGEGFSKWEYVAMARYFYQQYCYDSSEKQMAEFHQVVSRIIEIVLIEERAGNLDIAGIWPWCTLPSGKKWPLSKWVQVNTISPYKRASQLISKQRQVFT